jgi:hypothetical protein
MRSTYLVVATVATANAMVAPALKVSAPKVTSAEVDVKGSAVVPTNLAGGSVQSWYDSGIRLNSETATESTGKSGEKTAGSKISQLRIEGQAAVDRRAEMQALYAKSSVVKRAERMATVATLRKEGMATVARREAINRMADGLSVIRARNVAQVGYARKQKIAALKAEGAETVARREARAGSSSSATTIGGFSAPPPAGFEWGRTY